MVEEIPGLISVYSSIQREYKDLGQTKSKQTCMWRCCQPRSNIITLQELVAEVQKTRETNSKEKHETAALRITVDRTTSILYIPLCRWKLVVQQRGRSL